MRILTEDRLKRLAALLPSSRPQWLMMPRGAATHFNDMLLFSVSALEQAGLPYIIHYGSLLGAARLGGALPWDEDHDIFLYDVDAATFHARLADVFAEHGYRLVWDERGFYWVRERLWLAASGHVAIEFLPPLVKEEADLPVWEGGAPHLLEDELEPVQSLPVHGSHILAPAKTEAVLARLYGASASLKAMSGFKTSPIKTEAQAFWKRVRQPGHLDWPAISDRFRTRSKWRHLAHVPWWWFNGGYIIWINRIRRFAEARLSHMGLR